MTCGAALSSVGVTDVVSTGSLSKERSVGSTIVRAGLAPVSGMFASGLNTRYSTSFPATSVSSGPSGSMNVSPALPATCQ